MEAARGRVDAVVRWARRRPRAPWRRLGLGLLWPWGRARRRRSRESSDGDVMSEGERRRLLREEQRGEGERAPRAHVALLGPGESGKSTMFRFVGHNLVGWEREPGGETEEDHLRLTVRAGVVQGMRGFVQVAQITPEELDSPQERAGLAWLLRPDNAQAGEDPRVWFRTDDVASDLRALWAARVVQAKWRDRGQIGSPSYPIDYYLARDENVMRAGVPLPLTADDLLRVWVRTSGIPQDEFRLGDGACVIVSDTGGQRMERHKWTHLFTSREPPTLMVFVLSVADFDAMLYENHSTLRLEDALDALALVASRQECSRVPLLVVFNRFDDLVRKVRAGVRVRVPGFRFEGYDGPELPHDRAGTVEEVMRVVSSFVGWLERRFVDTARATSTFAGRPLATMATVAVDTAVMRETWRMFLDVARGSPFPSELDGPLADRLPWFSLSQDVWTFVPSPVELATLRLVPSRFGGPAWHVAGAARAPASAALFPPDREPATEDEMLARLVESDVLARCKRVEFSLLHNGEAFLTHFARRTVPLTNLEHVSLNECGLLSSSASALKAFVVAAASHVRFLDVSNNALGSRCVVEMVSGWANVNVSEDAPRTTALEELRIQNVGLDDVGMGSVSRMLALMAPNLRVLRAGGNFVLTAGAFSLANSGLLRVLEVLDLAPNYVRDAGVVALAHAVCEEHLHAATSLPLREFIVDDYSLTSESIMAWTRVVESGVAPRLRRVEIRSAFAEPWQWARLFTAAFSPPAHVELPTDMSLWRPRRGRDGDGDRDHNRDHNHDHNDAAEAAARRAVWMGLLRDVAARFGAPYLCSRAGELPPTARAFARSLASAAPSGSTPHALALALAPAPWCVVAKEASALDTLTSFGAVVSSASAPAPAPAPTRAGAVAFAHGAAP